MLELASSKDLCLMEPLLNTIMKSDALNRFETDKIEGGLVKKKWDGVVLTEH